MSTSQLSATRSDEGRQSQQALGRHYLKTPDAANYLGVSTSWLNKSRVSGTGPAFVRIGKAVVYSVEDLDAFATSRRVHSTSEKAA